jgi:hypothetical protein
MNGYRGRDADPGSKASCSLSPSQPTAQIARGVSFDSQAGRGVMHAGLAGVNMKDFCFDEL